MVVQNVFPKMYHVKQLLWEETAQKKNSYISRLSYYAKQCAMCNVQSNVIYGVKWMSFHTDTGQNIILLGYV